MHNHVATPTKQWVDLIKDPAKYGRVIREGKYPPKVGKLSSQTTFHDCPAVWFGRTGSSLVGTHRTPQSASSPRLSFREVYSTARLANQSLCILMPVDWHPWVA